jgi:glycosyltransferase involved in cell wall biosynthesis
VLDAVTDGQEAIVVPTGDRDALASAIVQILRSPELARALGGSARLRVQAFDLSVFADRLDAVYRRILTPGSGARQTAPAKATEAPRWA